MLYQRNRAGELAPMNEPNWHARRFVGNELLDIMNLLRNLIQQKGFNQNQMEFTASNLVGEHQIEWCEYEVYLALQILAAYLLTLSDTRTYEDELSVRIAREKYPNAKLVFVPPYA